MPLPPRPPVSDTIAIVDYVRQRGSVYYPLETVPGEFLLWRRKLRVEAKRTGIRISVRRGDDLVIVHNPDYRLSDDEKHALMDVMGAMTEQMLGTSEARQPTFEEALERRRRQRLQIVRDDER